MGANRAIRQALSQNRAYNATGYGYVNEDDYEVDDECSDCRGSGEIDGEECDNCGGTWCQP